jgi:hypothetical protein
MRRSSTVSRSPASWISSPWNSTRARKRSNSSRRCGSDRRLPRIPVSAGRLSLRTVLLQSLWSCPTRPWSKYSIYSIARKAPPCGLRRRPMCLLNFRGHSENTLRPQPHRRTLRGRHLSQEHARGRQWSAQVEPNEDATAKSVKPRDLSQARIAALAAANAPTRAVQLAARRELNQRGP